MKIDAVLFWYSGLAAWQALTPTNYPAPAAGTGVYYAVRWENDEAAAITGNAALTVTKPSGASMALTAYANQDQEADPGDKVTAYFNPITLDEVGTYAGEAKVKETGTTVILDTETFTAALVSSAVVAAGMTEMISAMMPLIMLMMMMGMLMPMMKGMTASY